MKKINYTPIIAIFTIVLAATLISLGVAPTVLQYNQPQAELYVGASADPNVYDPFNVTSAYEPSDSFTVYVKAKNISDLLSMDFYMYFNPNVTDCTAVRYGASWGVVLADYIGIAGIINNTKGSIEGYGAARLAPALSGNLTLFDIDFRMKDWGESLLQITDTPIVMLNSTEQEILSPMTDGWLSCPQYIPPPPPPTRVYLNPSTITATAVGQNFTVEIRVDNVTDLFALETGLTWDSNLLEVNISGPHNGFEFGPIWGTVLVDYIGIMGEINNITGEIYPSSGVSRIETGINGTELVLAYIDFVAKATGTSNVHLAEIVLINSKEEEIPTNVVDVFTIIVDENPPFHVITVHNLTGSPEVPFRLRLTDHTFSQEDKKISFNITGPIGTTGFCNVTIPKSLLDDNATHPWTILLNGINITDSVTPYENETHTSFYFTYTLSTQKVEIQGSWVVPEFPLAMIIPLLIAVTLAVALLGKKVQSTKRRVPHGSPGH